MLGHDRYEALAGAILLGEADAGERALYEAHALRCAACDDLASLVGVGARIADARERETWRPSITTGVFARIADNDGGRFRTTFAVLGTAFAASIVLNLALASGLTTFLSPAPPETAAPSGATPISFDTPSRHRSAHAELVARSMPRSRSSTRRNAGIHGTVVASTVHRSAQRSVRPNVQPPEPDVLDGLSLDDTASDPMIASEPRRPCIGDVEESHEPAACSPDGRGTSMRAGLVR